MSLPAHPPIAARVGGAAMLVGSAIDFDDEAETRGEKVRDISANDGLTSEAHAEASAPQRLPE
jgi:hypothetical protein